MTDQATALSAEKVVTALIFSFMVTVLVAAPGPPVGPVITGGVVALGTVPVME